MVARDARIGKCDVRLLRTPNQDFGPVEGVDLGDRTGRHQQGQAGRGVRTGVPDLAREHGGRRADRPDGLLRAPPRRRHRLLTGLDAAHHPEKPLAEGVVGLQLDPGRAHHRPVVLAGGVHHQGGQLAGQRPLVVGEALPVPWRQLDAVEVVDIDPADPYLAAVLDRPDEALAQLDRLHPGAEGPREQPFDGALQAPLEVPEKTHPGTIAARSGDHPVGAGLPGALRWTSVSPREASGGQLLPGEALVRHSSDFRPIRTCAACCNVPRPAAVYPPWPRNPVPASGSRHPCCTTGTKLVASRGTAGRIAGMAAATIRCRSSGEWRNWQTRRIQVPVSARTWGFKSPFAHFDGAPPRRGFGLCRRWRSPMTAGQPEQLVLRAPRLLDAHVHLVASGGPDLAAAIPPTEAERTLAAIANCRRQLDGGTTLVRDLGAPGGAVIALSRAIEAGTVEGPTVIAAGPAVTMTGGHIAYMGRVADGPEQMRAAVRANLALGAGCIKVVATGGVLTKGLDPRVAAYTQPELDALVDEAHRLGLRVAAHAIGEGGVATALRAGVDSVEHGMFLDQTCIELFLETGARYSATFSAPEGIIGGPSVPDWTKDRARPAAGAPENHHGRVSHEVVAMVEAGLDVLAGVRAVTAEAADLLGDPDRGTLRPGAIADVLAVHGDVVLDVSALTRPAAVFKSGRQVR